MGAMENASRNADQPKAHAGTPRRSPRIRTPTAPLTDPAALKTKVSNRSAALAGRRRERAPEAGRGRSARTGGAAYDLAPPPPGGTLGSAEERRRRELLERLNQIAEQKKVLATLRDVSDTVRGKNRRRTRGGGDTESSDDEELRQTRQAANRVHLPANVPGHRDTEARLQSPAISTRGQTGNAVPLSPLVSPSEPKTPKSKSSKPAVKKEYPRNKQSSYCLRLVRDYLRLKDTYGFSKPIDQIWSKEQLPGYFEMITHPMDLGTIRDRLTSGYYFSAAETTATDEAHKETTEESSLKFDAERFAEDVRLVYNNAKEYNQPGDMFYEAAVRLEEKFERKFAQLPPLTSPQKPRPPKKRKTTPRKTSDASDAPQATPLKSNGVRKSQERAESDVSASQKEVSQPSREQIEERIQLIRKGLEVGEKGRLERLYEIPMTLEEKIRLSEDVNFLSPEKLQKLIALVSRAMKSEMEVNEDEEVELDIEKLDNKTLRDMEAMVNSSLYRKGGKVQGMSREKAKAELARLERLLATMKKEAGEEERENGRKRSRDEDEDEEDEEESGSESESDSESGSSVSDSSDSDNDDGRANGDGDAGTDEIRKRRERNAAHMRQMAGVVTPAASPAYSTTGRAYENVPGSADNVITDNNKKQ